MGAADNPPEDEVPAAKTGSPQKRSDGDMGAALRSVYQKTIEEKIPDEFLDLLGKLG